VDPVAVAGIVALLFVKEAGVPIPVPGDLVVIAAGATVASRGPGAAIVLLAILAAGFAGGAVQFALLRGGVRRRVLSLMARIGVSADRIERLAARLRGRGAVGVAISRMTPGVRVVSIAASALALIPVGTFVRGLVLGNAIFVSAHFALGFALGASAASVLARDAGAVMPLVIGVAALAALGAIGWTVVRRRSAAGGRRAAVSWADACCPACLTVAALVQPADAGSRIG
jgi:membrane protein DedA with SNARE-associated domain